MVSKLHGTKLNGSLSDLSQYITGKVPGVMTHVTDGYVSCIFAIAIPLREGHPSAVCIPRTGRPAGADVL